MVRTTRPSTLAALLAWVLLLSLPASGSEAAGGEPGDLRIFPRSQFELAAWAWGAEAAATLSGDLLLVPLGAGGVALYDVADPRVPQPVAILDVATLGGQGGAATALPGERAFVALPDVPTIAVFDLSTPPAPVWLGEFGDIEVPLALAVAGGQLFVQEGSYQGHLGGVHAFDLGPSLPEPEGGYLVELVDPGFAALGGGAIALARTPGGWTGVASIDVVDLSDPAAPELLGQWSSPLPGNVTGISVAGDRMFLSAYWGGLWVVDVSDYAAMSLVTSFDWPEPEPYALDVESVAPYILLLQGGPAPEMQRLMVFRLDGGQIAFVDELAATSTPHSIARRDRLLVFEEWFDTDGDGYPDRKRIRLFELLFVVFADGFESGDTSAWD